MDLHHAREHLNDLARLLEFMLLDNKQDWLAARMEDLDYGDIDGICKAARAYRLTGIKKDELDTALGYFENQRLKQSGMHWTVNGADAIIALRCREASSQWEAICNTPRTQTQTA